MIDWDAPVKAPEVGRTVRIIERERPAPAEQPEPARRRRALESAGGHEGGGPIAATERIERLQAAMRGAGADPDLAEAVTRGAREGLAKAAGGDATFTRRDMIGLEAVILTDGTRPSLSVVDGFVDLAADEVGDWKFALRHFEQAIRSVIAAVGRIDIPVKPGFAGTGFAIGPDRVLTNRHVAEAIATENGEGWSLKWPDATKIDFVGEDGKSSVATAQVTGIVFAGPDPIGSSLDFAHLDAAILRCVPLDGGLPAPVRFDPGPSGMVDDRALYAVGFPGRPRTWFGPGAPPARHETTEVMASVFNDRFGVKKLAPGRVDALPGTLAGDETKKWVFSHDASTLGGNSGSALVDLDEDGARIIGLHFAGFARDENYGHACAALRPSIEPQGASYG